MLWLFASIFLAVITLLAPMVGSAIFILMCAVCKHPCGAIKNLLRYFATLLLSIPTIFFGILAILIVAAFNRWSSKKIPLVNTTCGHSSDAVVLVTVHGTFAQNAKWARQDSPLLNAIKHELKPNSIENFQWSGGNSVKDRKVASEKLQTVLNGLADNHCQVHLIAHSHGGAVVADAITVQNMPCSIVFMATPFISTEEAKLEVIARRSFELGPVVACALIAALVAYFFISLRTAVMFFGLCLVLGAAVQLAFSYCRSRSNKDADKSVEPPAGSAILPTAREKPAIGIDVIATKPDATRIYIRTGDEAGALLQFSSMLGSKVRQSIGALFDALDVLDKTVSHNREHSTIKQYTLPLLGLFVAVVIGLWLAHQPKDSHWWISAPILLGLCFIFLGTIKTGYASGRRTIEENLCAALILHCGLVAVMNALTKLAFGFPFLQAITEHEIIVTSSETPEGKWNVHKLASVHSVGGGLQHSDLYSDLTTVTEIAQFMKLRTEQENSAV